MIPVLATIHCVSVCGIRLQEGQSDLPKVVLIKDIGGYVVTSCNLRLEVCVISLQGHSHFWLGWY